MTSAPRVLASLAALTVLIACESPRSGAESALAPRVGGIQAMSFANSEWSTPVNLGPAINSTSNEVQPTMSKDGLTLYFASTRPGVGDNDIWFSRRDCADCPWEAAVNLVVINTPFLDGGPMVSDDGHLLFFHSNRPGGVGNNDIYVSHRANPNDDFGWEAPKHLGTDVNTPAQENNAEYRQNLEDGAGNLYFNRGPSSAVLNDIYYAAVTRNGETRGAAVIIAELSDPGFHDACARVRADGREVVFTSNRVGTVGPTDLWVSTRRSIHDGWSTPENLGLPVNSTFGEQTSGLSPDGRALLIDSDRPGGVGGRDIWMSTRTPSGN